MLDSLLHLLGQVPGRAFPDERRVPQLARQHGCCCSRRVVQVLALIELLRARTRVELQKFMNLRIGRFLQWYWNMQAHSGLPGVAITCWGGQWVRLNMNPAFLLSCYHFVSDVMSVFLSGTPSLTSTSACWNYTNSTWLPRNILNRLWGEKLGLKTIDENLDLFPGRSTRTLNIMASLTSSLPSSLVHPSRVYSISSLASPDPSLGLLYRQISSACYRL